MLTMPSPLITYTSQILLFLSLAFLIYSFRHLIGRAFAAIGTIGPENSLDFKTDLVLLGLASLATVTCLLMVVGLPFGVALAGGLIAGIATPFVVVRRRRVKFVEAFDRSLVTSLQTVSSSLKAGLTLQDSLTVAADNCEPVFAEEVGRALKEYRFGVPIEEALDRIRKRVRTSNCNIAFGAMIISSQLGGRLPVMLQKIIGTIRERQRVEGKLASLTAQGRAQAVLLCSAPPVLGFGMYFYDPAMMSLLTDQFIGQIFLVIAILLEVIGIVVTMRVMKLEV